ncbi:hypothetical protein [Desulfopila sp. IMCC35008]|uniref:hypothetical protein n=1 Tax=Desulfopila sp. IMCC35008 TaxID=2653858 RepID=UPI0013D8C615|nr:hypothetical protein [Desulfopila sp. IMCC35008]
MLKRLFWILCLSLFFCSGVLTLGCAPRTSLHLKNMRPFTPVRVEFKGTYRDADTEQFIRDRLFCVKCLFKEAEAGAEPTPHSMTIEYYRAIDPKALAQALLTGAMAPVEAEFSYGFEVSLMKGPRMVKEYIFTKRHIEKTDSALDGILNPFHKSNSKSEEVFTELLNTFLQEINEDSPLPRQDGQKS